MNTSLFSGSVLVAALTCALAISACGGGYDAEAERQLQITQLRAQANVQEAKAKQLGLDTPCANDRQCLALAFKPMSSPCAFTTFFAYSSLTPGATQAEAAADSQRSLAAQANALAYPQAVCAAIAVQKPELSCNAASRCVLVTP